MTNIALETRELMVGVQRYFCIYIYICVQECSPNILFRYLTTKVEKIDKYFPASSNKQIHEFLSNDDGKFEARTEALTAYLSTVSDPRGNNLRTFTDALKDLLFDREYVATHKWVFTK